MMTTVAATVRGNWRARLARMRRWSSASPGIDLTFTDDELAEALLQVLSAYQRVLDHMADERLSLLRRVIDSKGSLTVAELFHGSFSRGTIGHARLSYLRDRLLIRAREGGRFALNKHPVLTSLAQKLLDAR